MRRAVSARCGKLVGREEGVAHHRRAADPLRVTVVYDEAVGPDTAPHDRISRHPDVIARAAAIVRQHPQIRSIVEANGVIAHPFEDETVWVCFEDYWDEWTVFVGAWHGHYEDADDALKVFGAAFQPSARLMVVSRGSKETRWRLEADDGEVIFDMGEWPVPLRFWRRRRVRYLKSKASPS